VEISIWTLIVQEAMELLPKNYSFEIPKTIHRVRTSSAKRVALQFCEECVWERLEQVEISIWTLIVPE
jgi:hypothetical protein